MNTLVLCTLLASLTALGVTPWVRQVALGMGWVDPVGGRKQHPAGTPRLGGVGVVAGFAVALVAVLWIGGPASGALWAAPSLLGALGLGGALIAALGLVDDLWGVSPWAKLGVQTAVACAVVGSGLLVERLDLPWIEVFELGWLGPPLTVLWIVGVTNAVNLLDGLDGLAGGVVALALLPLVAIGAREGNLVLAVVACALLGAVLGFLVFNWHPARIFLGDSGSLFLGYVLAVVTVAAIHKTTTAGAMLGPVLGLGVPVLDALRVLGRRGLQGRSLFTGDRQHVHHRLLDAGLSHGAAVAALWSLSALLSLMGLALTLHRDWANGLLLLASLASTLALLAWSGALRPAQVARAPATVAEPSQVRLGWPAWAVSAVLVGCLFDTQLPGPLTVSLGLSLALAGGWFVRCALRGEPFLSWTPISYPLLLALCATLISVEASGSPWWSARKALSLALLAGLLHLIARAVRPAEVLRLLRGLGAVLLLLLVMSLVPEVPSRAVGAVDAAWRVRNTGPYGDANLWCAALVLCVPMVLAAWGSVPGRLAGAICLLLAALYPVVVLQSMSRAGLIAALVTLPFVVLVLRRRPRVLLAAGLLCLLLSPLVVDLAGLALRMRSLAQPSLELDLGHASLSQRAGLLEVGRELVRAHPWRGVGVGMFASYSGPVTAGWQPKVAHNTYLTLAAELGVVGLIAYLWLGLNLGWLALRAAVGPGATRRRVALGWLGGLLGFAILSGTLELLDFHLLWSVVGLGLALVSPPQLRGSEPVLEQGQADAQDRTHHQGQAQAEPGPGPARLAGGAGEVDHLDVADEPGGACVTTR